MHLKDNIKNFIFDQGYYVSFYQDCIYFYNFVRIEYVFKSKSKIIFDNFILELEGDNFFVEKIVSKELLLKGVIKELKIIYE